LFTLADVTQPHGWHQVESVLFLIFASLSVISAWAIVLSQNIVRMAVYLLFTLCGVAGLYFMMDAEFLAAIQLIVYAGGTLILILFGVMLTSRNPFVQIQTALWEKFVGIFIAFVLAALLIFAMIQSPVEGNGHVVTAKAGIREIGMGLIHQYIVPFEVAAVLLLVVMIGAAYMARRRV